MVREFWIKEILEEDKLVSLENKKNLIKSAKILGFTIELRSGRIFENNKEITVGELIEKIIEELGRIDRISGIIKEHRKEEE